MPTPPSLRSRRVTSPTRVTVVALVVGALVAVPLVASGAGASSLKSAKVGRYTTALVNQGSRSLYVLSVEKGTKLKCTAACLSSWIPLEVPTSVTSVSLGSGVDGKIGFVARSKSKKQVTFNSYPIYTFVGDGGALQSHGQGVVAFGGKWTLVRASSRAAATTPFASAAAPSPPTTTTHPPTTTTNPPPTTTTTTPSGGGSAY
jgi:predicted lipoprotein with Yx(FWY)xxD motif